MSNNNNFVLILLISMMVILEVGARRESLFKLGSREEMVNLAGYGEEKLSTVMVTGTVFCEAPAPAQLYEWPVSGASVGIKCHSREMMRRRRKWRWAHGTTDENGDFVVDLPSHLHAIPNLERVCRVKILGVPRNSLCQPPNYVGTMKLSSVGNGIRIYSAGTIKFLHSASKPSPDPDI